MKQIRFIHAADLHLDSPYAGLRKLPKGIFKRVQESTFSSMEKMVEFAIRTRVDFMLLVGDLFDGEDRSIKAQARLRKQMEKLLEHNIEIFVLHGNHDHLSGSWTTIHMPENVHTFSAEAEKLEYKAKDGTKVNLYGFSYPTRHVLEKVIDTYPQAEGADFHIGLLHGQLEGGNTDHQPYAPFTVPDLLEKGMDYWALGHIHKHQILHEDPYIVYPGNIQGRNRKESGPKGCTMVTLTDETASLQFVETSDIVWHSAEIYIQGINDFSALYLECREQVEKVRRKEQGTLLKIVLHDDGSLDEESVQKMKNGELLDVLQDGEEEEDAFVWVYDIERKMNDVSHQNQEASFLKEISRTEEHLIERNAFEAALGELYLQRYASRYLEEISEEEQKQLLEEAHELISFYIAKS
ncbi:metallophosphoesterase family protein [Heyndrickxia acidicola]|uniref:DNA repair exonuclease n=1 Tax=Heyndrickxia acidicola TaxID=209389 RepID=A0ABU6MCP3_9BACI|nr:DNA repair exonuclease [Heyndrickxia acidicola]MED1202426.1 DNA repair exonuclease [Heyndrickxia acidicola]